MTLTYENSLASMKEAEFVAHNKNCIIIGKSGSGKSTLLRFFQELNYNCLSCSDLLRKAMHSNKEYSNEIALCAEQVLAIPDDIVFDVINKELKMIIRSPFVIESFPVNLNQYYYLIEKLRQGNCLNKTYFLYLDVPEETLIYRIIHRRTCSLCFSSYHLIDHPPQIPGYCDSCHQPLFQREQDQEVKIRNRFNMFKQYTMPMLERVKSDCLPIIRLTGQQDVMDFRAQLTKLLIR